MNIIEAVSTGRRFRRPKWMSWLSQEEVENFPFSTEDLQAQDYYVELKKVTIDAEQFDVAWNKADYAINTEDERTLIFMRDRLKKELGL